MNEPVLLEGCMYSCYRALISACISIVAGGELSAEMTSSELPVTSFTDWEGYAFQSSTLDGSVLNEFVAQTTSIAQKGAVLSVTMIPRFSCAPVISVVLDKVLVAAQPSQIEFSVKMDAQSLSYPFIVDSNFAQFRFTLNATAQEQEKIREALDVASWASISWTKITDVPVLSKVSSDSPNLAPDETFQFSLLGSQRTVEAMEHLCRSHIPSPFKN